MEMLLHAYDTWSKHFILIIEVKKCTPRMKSSNKIEIK